MRSVRRRACSGSPPLQWDELFQAFVVSHLVGDYLLQTEWQALNKRGGLGGSPVQTRALCSHVATYALAFVPTLAGVWARSRSKGLGLAALIAIPHLIQDDARLLCQYARLVKKADIQENQGLGAALDQSFHILALFLTARLAAR